MKHKELLPYTTKHFNQLKELHQEAIQRYQKDNQKIFYQQIHELREKMFEYENVVLYNKYAINHCKFGNSIDTEEICEHVFTQTLKHYSIHGNCCKSCSTHFSYVVQPKKADSVIDTLIDEENKIKAEHLKEFEAIYDLSPWKLLSTYNRLTKE